MEKHSHILRKEKLHIDGGLWYNHCYTHIKERLQWAYYEKPFVFCWHLQY